MTVPAIFSSTASLPSAIAGFVVALILAYFERGLLTVAADRVTLLSESFHWDE